jgi:hypothetical protein
MSPAIRQNGPRGCAKRGVANDASCDDTIEAGFSR